MWFKKAWWFTLICFLLFGKPAKYPSNKWSTSHLDGLVVFIALFDANRTAWERKTRYQWQGAQVCAIRRKCKWGGVSLNSGVRWQGDPATPLELDLRRLWICIDRSSFHWLVMYHCAGHHTWVINQMTAPEAVSFWLARRLASLGRAMYLRLSPEPCRTRVFVIPHLSFTSPAASERRPSVASAFRELNLSCRVCTSVHLLHPGFKGG